MSPERDKLEFELFAAQMSAEKSDVSSKEALEHYKAQQHRACGALSDDVIHGVRGGIAQMKFGRDAIDLPLPERSNTLLLERDAAGLGRAMLAEKHTATPSAFSQDVALARMLDRRSRAGVAPTIVLRREGGPSKGPGKI